MVLYKCERCLKSFKQKNDYYRHCNRVFPCKKVENNDIQQSEKIRLQKSKLLQMAPKRSK